MAQQVGTVSRRSTAVHEDGNGSEAPSRTVRRRRGLPGSRAVVGGLLVAASAVGLFAAASRSGDGPTHSYVVAGEDLAAGTRLEASHLQLMPMNLAPAVRARVFDRAEPLLGTTLVAPLAAGELVQASAVVARRADAGSRELSFAVERGRLSPGVKQGERADVLATYGTGNDAFTTVVVRQVAIVGIERPRAGDPGATTVTVAVDEAGDALALAHALQLGKVTVVRATGAPPMPVVPPTFRVGRT